MSRRGLSIALCGLSIIACGSKAPPPSTSQPGGDTITLNPSTIYQTMTGWEVPVLSTVLDYAPIVGFIGPLLDQAGNDLGLNKISFELTSGVESPSDTCQLQYLNRIISEGQYVAGCAYNSVNDNADPNVINLNGFHFPILDWQIENLVLPLKQRVAARGEKLYVQLRYIDFEASPFEHYQNPEEYAELLQVVFEHMATKYGFTPDGVDVMNEPDQVVGWDATTIGRVIVRSGQRLAALGYRPDFIGPSTVDKARAVPYFEAMMNVSGAGQYLKDLSWHCYADGGSNTSAAIAGKATQYGVRTSMTECWNTSNTYQMLHQELKASRNASWQLATISGVNGYYDVNTVTGQATLRPKAKLIRQYYKYIRAGARRIEAATTNSSFDPVAFINTDGRYVVVVKANSAGSLTIGNLPAGTYGIFYTTGPDGLTVSNYDVNVADQTVSAGRGIATSIPSAGVITVFSKSSGAIIGQATAVEPTASPTITEVERLESRASAAGAWPKTNELVTQDGVRLRFERIAGSVADPVDVAFTPDGRLFVAERDGHVRVVRDGRLLTEPALSLEDRVDGREQFLALAVDPQFDRTHYVYTISTTRSESRVPAFLVTRFREAWDTLADRIRLLDKVPSSPDGPAASLRFGPDGKLFAAFDDAGVERVAGDLASVSGKVLRLNPDGTTPDDQAAGSPLFSYSYRSPHGFDWHPTTHTLWLADRDSSVSSRLNVVATSDGPQKRGVVRATLRLPAGTLASSVAFYRGASNTAMRDNLFVASAEGRHLLRVQLDPQEPTRVIATERLLQDEIGDIRVVAVGSDGAIYVATANALGRLVPHR